MQKTQVDVDYEKLQKQRATEQAHRDRDAAWNEEVMAMSKEVGAALEEAREADAQRVAEQVETDFKQSVLSSFVQAGGKAAQFESEWPALRSEIVRRRTFELFAQQQAAGDVVDATLNDLHSSSR